MTRSVRRLAAALALVSLPVALGACSSDDVNRETFTSELRDKANLDGDVASCITERLYDELDQGDINDLYEAAPNEAAPRAREVFEEASAQCRSAEG